MSIGYVRYGRGSNNNNTVIRYLTQSLGSAKARKREGIDE